MRSLVINWEKRGRYPNIEGGAPGISPRAASTVSMAPFDVVWTQFSFMGNFSYYSPLKLQLD